jgi:hypothetical protein
LEQTDLTRAQPHDQAYSVRKRHPYLFYNESTRTRSLGP